METARLLLKGLAREHESRNEAYQTLEWSKLMKVVKGMENEELKRYMLMSLREDKLEDAADTLMDYIFKVKRRSQEGGWRKKREKPERWKGR